MNTSHTRIVRLTEQDERLRDAAPDLLEAVKALIATADHTKPIGWRRHLPVSLALAAILKAEG